ncbi:pyridoxamine 5'-phosphate oxidase family protein [Phenylobacterium sp.]|uniref:pyridoxamine 5'-phosphate oxidase family protein n=1 Tax=Phenylobacterium sp. TaxID=1871053 RepID=UPI002ED8FD98
MPQHLVSDILAILVEGQDMAVATTFPDGAPHAVTVSYVSEGLALYFGCSPGSQKARNLDHDDRLAITVTLPYRDWSQIRGLSLCGRARPVAPGLEQTRVAALFAAKFSEIAQYVSDVGDDLALFEVTPEVIGVLDYRRGFGHVEHVRVLQLDPPRTERLTHEARRT